MSRYPRVCRNGHAVNGPADEVQQRGTSLKCRTCVNLMSVKTRAKPGSWYAKNVCSGRSATRQARYKRARAEARDLQHLEALRGSNERRQG